MRCQKSKFILSNKTTYLNCAYMSPMLKKVEKAGISGIKGHRSVGGFRASMYNAMEIESVQTLVQVMQEFENTRG